MAEDYRELLIGAGSRREKVLHPDEHKTWEHLTTLDINADHKPDVIWDLTDLPLPFEDDSFNEMHAYEVLEHIGAQGDYKTFFAQFSEFWRILRPGGLLCGTSPAVGSPWVWGDPGHTRLISSESFVFLDQTEYTRQVGNTPMSDYRFVYQADFSLVFARAETDTFMYVLQAVKPSRISF
ncbi:MAG: class I SAM-dependent methyltransferase [Chloroflexi bacterium]|nr:class I SAM-dependent methyltransferase [Chloroflexota bacterium]